MLGGYVVPGLQPANNLSDLASAAAARNNLGNAFGNSLWVDVAGNDSNNGSNLSPFASLAAAVTAAAASAAPKKIFVGPGFFNLGASPLVLPDNVEIAGDGNCEGNITCVVTYAGGSTTPSPADTYRSQTNATHQGQLIFNGSAGNYVIWWNGTNWICSSAVGTTSGNYWTGETSGMFPGSLNGASAIAFSASGTATGTASVSCFASGTVLYGAAPYALGRQITPGNNGILRDFMIFCLSGLNGTTTTATVCIGFFGNATATNAWQAGTNVKMVNVGAWSARAAVAIATNLGNPHGVPPTKIVYEMRDCWLQGQLDGVNQHIQYSGSSSQVTTYKCWIAGQQDGSNPLSSSPYCAAVGGGGGAQDTWIDYGSTLSSNVTASSGDIEAACVMASMGSIQLSGTTFITPANSSGGAIHTIDTTVAPAMPCITLNEGVTMDETKIASTAETVDGWQVGYVGDGVTGPNIIVDTRRRPQSPLPYFFNDFGNDPIIITPDASQSHFFNYSAGIDGSTLEPPINLYDGDEIVLRAIGTGAGFTLTLGAGIHTSGSSTIDLYTGSTGTTNYLRLRKNAPMNRVDLVEVNSAG